MHRIYFLIVCLTLGLAACVQPLNEESENTSDFSDSVVCAIHLFKDKRELAPILPHLQSRSELRRWHAALALGSFSDSSAVPYLELALKDRSIEVRKMVAFALAQTKSERASIVLLKGIKAARPDKERPFLLEALGINGGQHALDFLLQLRGSDPLDEIGRLKGLYRLSLSNKDSRLTEAFKTCIKQSDDSLHLYYAISGLLRVKAPLEKKYFDTITSIYTRHSHHNLRLKCIQALSLLTDLQDDSFIREQLFTEETATSIKQACYLVLSDKKHLEADWLANTYNNEAPFNEQWCWAKAMAARQKGTIPTDCDSLIMLYLRLSTARQDEIVRLFEKALNDPDLSPVWLSICIDQIESNDPFMLSFLAGVFYKRELPSIVRNSLYAKLLQKNENDLEDLLLKGLRSKDMALVSLAIYKMREINWSASDKLKWSAELRSILPHYCHARGWETYLDIIHLLDRWGMNEETEVVMPKRRTLKMDDLKNLAHECQLEMYLEKDTIKLVLDQRFAPATAIAISRAVDSAYYNDKIFHRIAPLFVAQMGCQRGDGWGSPDALLRSELSPRSFDQNTIGIASAGKDTEGYQLFFMLEAAPHLDGKYTHLGQILSGNNKLQNIKPGERIYGMKLVEKKLN